MNTTASLRIQPDDLSDGKVIALLEAHHKEMYLYSPPESIHSLKKSEFFDPSMRFWSARNEDDVAACGGLKQLSSEHAEIKSMKTASQYLRRGLAEKILLHIIETAREDGLKRLSLETGSHEAFTPAIRLYEKHGFVECGPFGDYKLDPYSRFFRRDLLAA